MTTETTRTDAARRAPHKPDCACRPCQGRRRKLAAEVDLSALWLGIADAALLEACRVEDAAQDSQRHGRAPEVEADPVEDAEHEVLWLGKDFNRPVRIKRRSLPEPTLKPAGLIQRFCNHCGACCEATAEALYAQQREHERAHVLAGHQLEHEARRWSKTRIANANPLAEVAALPDLKGPQARICMRCRRRVRGADIEALVIAQTTHGRACHGGWVASEKQKWAVL